MTILDEKPKIGLKILSETESEPDLAKYIVEIDTWLEKVQPYVELAEQIIETFNEELPHEEIIAGFKAREHLRKTYDMITEYARKAETLDKIIELRYWTEENEPSLDNILKLIEKAEKVEAVKTFRAELKENYAIATTSRGRYVIDGLGEILGEEE